MDVLYVVGKDSGHGNIELRWSLRSIARYARNVGRVVVAGYPPDWLAPGVVRVPVADCETDYKFTRIFRAVLFAIDTKAVTGEFLWGGDDLILSAPRDLDATPFWFRRKCLIPFNENQSGGPGYRKSLHATREMLVRAGYSARDCANHCFMRIDAADAGNARVIVKSYKGEYAHFGPDVSSLFCNIRAARQVIPWKYRYDWKINCFNRVAVESGQFSFSDEAFSDADFMAYMNAHFGTKCQFER